MPAATTPAISLKNVSLVRNITTILSDISWTLPANSSAAILGPNGSGKTTLTRVITGYEWPTTGSVVVLGETLGETDTRQLRRRVQIINPSDRFGIDPNLTALDATLTGYTASLFLYETPTVDQRDHAAHLLHTVGLSHRITHRYGLLSTGEQRRCLLARALVQLPDILILDEPTAGLDLAGREHLLATISQLRDQIPAVITITHHVEEIAPKTDQVMLLKQGRIAALGKPDDVITPEHLSNLYGCKVFVQKRSGRHWLEVLPEAWIDLLKPR